MAFLSALLVSVMKKDAAPFFLTSMSVPPPAPSKLESLWPEKVNWYTPAMLNVNTPLFKSNASSDEKVFVGKEMISFLKKSPSPSLLRPKKTLVVS